MTSFQHPPEVEGLSEFTWRRVEQSLERKLDSLELDESNVDIRPDRRSARPLVYALGAVSAAAAVFLFIAKGAETSPSKAVSTASAPQISHVQSRDSSTDLVLDGATVELAPHSSVQVEQQGPALSLRLQSGEVHLKVAPRAANAPLRVYSGEVTVEVIGTEFSVAQDEGQTQVVVYEGVVAVERGHERSRVEAGQSWPPAAKDREGTVASRKRRASKKRHHTAKEHEAKDKAPHEVSARELFESALELEGTAPAEAREAYSRAAAMSGPWAANALFAWARMEFEAGHGAKARQLAQRYLNRFPDGANQADAQALRDRLDSTP